MARFPVLLLPLLLSACSGGPSDSSDASDACKAVSPDALGVIFGSKVKAAELAGVQDMQDETRSTCEGDFVDGQWLSVTGTDRKTPFTVEEKSTYSGRNDELSARFGYPVFHSSRSKELTPFIGPARELYLR